MASGQPKTLKKDLVPTQEKSILSVPAAMGDFWGITARLRRGPWF